VILTATTRGRLRRRALAGRTGSGSGGHCRSWRKRRSHRSTDVRLSQ
jgi:hypothetical protein